MEIFFFSANETFLVVLVKLNIIGTDEKTRNYFFLPHSSFKHHWNIFEKKFSGFWIGWKAFSFGITFLWLCWASCCVAKDNRLQTRWTRWLLSAIKPLTVDECSHKSLVWSMMSMKAPLFESTIDIIHD